MGKQLTTRSRGERGILWVFRGAKGLVGHLGFILVTLSATTLAFSPLSLWWLGVGGVLGVAGLVCEVRVRPNYARLTDELVELRADAVTLASGIENIVESMLRSVMSELAIDFTVARISSYRHVDQSFVLIARVSQDRALEAVGRRSYPDDQGIISRVWRNGVDHVTGLPDDRDEWNLRCSLDYGIPCAAAGNQGSSAMSGVG